MKDEKEKMEERRSKEGKSIEEEARSKMDGQGGARGLPGAVNIDHRHLIILKVTAARPEALRHARHKGDGQKGGTKGEGGGKTGRDYIERKL